MSRLLVVPILLAVACGPGAAPRSPTPEPGPVARTPTPVPAGYADATEGTLQEGRAALQLLLDNKLTELRALLTPELAEIWTEEMLIALRDELLEAGAISRGDDAVFLVAGTRAYMAQVKAGPHAAGATMAFDDKGTMIALTFVPRADLPADPHAARPVKSRLRLPFDGQWWVLWGGDNETLNYHVIAPDQRHAYDIVMWKDGRTHRGDGKKLDDYYCWGRPLVAPADATVVAAENEAPDNAPGVMDPAHKAGNHVLLDLGNGEFALIAHMQKGSVAVKAGDKVTVGQRLGLTGNSGNTSEPHVHFHVQDGPVLFEGAGIPVWFEGVCTDGQAAARTSPVHGQFIEDCE